MRGKEPRRLNRIREQLFADEETRAEYVTQRTISQLAAIVDRVLRKEKLSQTALAQRVGMHQPDLNALLKGRAEHLPTLATLRRLAQGLGVGLAVRIDPDGGMRIRSAARSPEAEPVAERGSASFEASR
jgi:transcriptional regulator with XRE-family HTH domain